MVTLPEAEAVPVRVEDLRQRVQFLPLRLVVWLLELARIPVMPLTSARSTTRRNLPAVSPRKLPMTLSYRTATKGTLRASAIAPARVVFPFPGGPDIKTRLRGSNP